ncbi:unnamed protein product [Bemisia tabaci]|uniref:CCDC113/CCDC96 coiled-coil domain-containing protein n=1 Tax=Bemisia tabaci TaxID=7038 RepID=A0A9P0A5G8_BEMTA|nr:unnamed protein product [Bemisia tabaci]
MSAERETDSDTNPCDTDDGETKPPLHPGALPDPPASPSEESTDAEGVQTRDLSGSAVAAEQLSSLVAAHSLLKRKNVYLLKKLFAHCKRKKIGGVSATDEWTSGKGDGVDCQEKYQETLELYFGLKRGVEKEEHLVQEEMSLLERELAEREAVASAANQELTKLQTSIGKRLLHPKTARQLTSKTIEAMISEQNSKMKDLREARLEYINMKNLVVKKKRQLTEMEHVDSGLRIQDFQQLQIDHQSLDRKIEDREEDLRKAELKLSESQESERRLEARVTCVQAALSKARLIFSRTQQLSTEESERLEELKRERVRMLKQDVSTKRIDLSAYPALQENYAANLKKMEARQRKLEALRASQFKINRSVQQTKRRIRILHKRNASLQGLGPGPTTTPVRKPSPRITRTPVPRIQLPAMSPES